MTDTTNWPAWLALMTALSALVALAWWNDWRGEMTQQERSRNDFKDFIGVVIIGAVAYAMIWARALGF